jgi:uncharacterized membrane protein
MDLTHIHLLLNHAPVAALAFGLLVLAIGLFRHSQPLRLWAMALFVMGSVLVLPVYFTGEHAEEAVEKLPGVSESIIEMHEESATSSLVGLVSLGVVSAGALLLYASRKITPSVLSSAVLALAIAASALTVRTAYLGGQIRHTEIRDGAVPASELMDSRAED